jgi:hypothetical protein
VERKRFLIPAGIVLLLWLVVAISTGIVLLWSLVVAIGNEPDPGRPTAASAPATTAVVTTALPTTTAAPTITTRPTTTTKRPTPTTKRRLIAAPTTQRPTPTTRPASNCHPSYQGECLRVGIGDYDCAGGSGNGREHPGDRGGQRCVPLGVDDGAADRGGDPGRAAKGAEHGLPSPWRLNDALCELEAAVVPGRADCPAHRRGSRQW